MPGYNFAYKNREQKSGGGVGAYLKEELDFKNTGRFDQTWYNNWIIMAVNEKKK